MAHYESIPLPEDFRHSTPLQLRFNDIDILGHVNNTVYLSFYDTGKAHYFNDVRHGAVNWRKVDTVIANIDCAYISPIFFGDDVEVRTRCVAIGGKSFRLQQMILERKTMTPKSICETVMVCFDPATGKSVPVDPEWRRLLCEYEGRELPDIN